MGSACCKTDTSGCMISRWHRSYGGVATGSGSWRACGLGQGSRRAHRDLQVMLNNAAALRLYERVGFREIYPYWYRVKT